MRWFPKVGESVMYCGRVLVDARDGGPVRFIVESIDSPGMTYNTLAGPMVSTEHIVHLALPADPEKSVFAAAISHLSREV